MTPISIFVCEPQPIVLEGLERVFAGEPDLVLVGYRHNVAETLEALRTVSADLILIDQGTGIKAAMQLISDLKSMAPSVRPVLWVQDLAEVECFRALQSGARGVIRKALPIGALLECLRAVAEGSVWIENSPIDQGDGRLQRRSVPRLTPREREIVQHICRGLKNKEIADTLSITPGTVKVHLMHIFEKTGVKDRFELAVHGRKLAGEPHV